MYLFFWLRIDAFWLRIDALVDLGEGGLVKIFLFLKRGPFLFSDFKNLKNRFLLRLVVVHSLGSAISALEGVGGFIGRKCAVFVSYHSHVHEGKCWPTGTFAEQRQKMQEVSYQLWYDGLG